ncbi:hypothetical protein [Methanofollis tationis]|uniref:Uncharacterized protein n=1 Tax=Methanofollis tationis TaxID=81417 RepID=A0A7K4HPC2_9EURY|nr:hypothetical protein [Methanofollis tationis]NVO67125.1 hypothetical protein [Methanofollis tationis]
MACECEEQEMQWSFLQKIRGDGLDRGKMLRGEEDVRGFLGRNAADLPPAEAMLLRLRKFDPGL